MKIFIYFLIFLQIGQASAASFTDTDLSLYRDAIVTLSDEGVISGYGDGRFGSDNTITRAEILKVFLRAKGIDTSTAPTIRCFKDVGITLWYHPYICEGVRLGMVKGFDNGTFGPDKPVTTLEALAMGLRLYGLAPSGGNPWYLPYQALADQYHLLDSASYSVSTLMTRDKASDLILKIRKYSQSKSVQSSISRGCINPQSLKSGTHEITVAGTTRSYILTVPSSYSLSNPAKLIIAIHGRTNNNSMIQDYMGLERQSDYIVAYPAGLPNGKAYSWSSADNITFVDTIIRDVTDSLCVDKTHISVVAHSLGASFASRLACTRGDVFRGMAIVGGGSYEKSCNDTPTASLIYQRPDDTLSSPATARATESQMRKVNQCGATTESVQVGGLNCQKWKDCSTGNPVVWCDDYSTYGNDPHSWPTSAGNGILGWLRGL